MDVAEFFSELRRMCKSSNDCTKCQYHGNKCDNANEIFEKTVAVVEKWSQEHPRKTRQSEFLNMCPTARVDDMCGEVIDAPAADVAPVVRCENCRYAMWVEWAKKYSCGQVRGLLVFGDHFCAFGKREYESRPQASL